MGKIHRTGYWHGFLSAHNLTLACEIIDFGFGEGSKKLEDYNSEQQREFIDIDIGGAVSTLNLIPYQLRKLGLIGENYTINPEELFAKAYKGDK